MAEDNKTLTVSIAGKDYQVACPAGEEDSLREAAQYLHNLMESIRSSGRVVGLDRVAVMAALNISNELLQSKQQHDAEQAKVSSQLVAVGAKDQLVRRIMESMERVRRANMPPRDTPSGAPPKSGAPSRSTALR